MRTLPLLLLLAGCPKQSTPPEPTGPMLLGPGEISVVDGDLGVTLGTRALGGVMGMASACVQKDAVPGQVVLAFTVEADGSASAVEVASTEPAANAKPGPCLAEAFAPLRFGTSGEGSATVHLPLTLSRPE